MPVQWILSRWLKPVGISRSNRVNRGVTKRRRTKILHLSFWSQILTFSKLRMTSVPMSSIVKDTCSQQKAQTTTTNMTKHHVFKHQQQQQYISSNINKTTLTHVISQKTQTPLTIFYHLLFNVEWQKKMIILQFQTKLTHHSMKQTQTFMLFFQLMVAYSTICSVIVALMW